jgi:ergothioneine biosynthesis protein EgtB
MGVSVRPSAGREASAWALRYRQVRQATLSLCAPLTAEDMQLQPMPDASPAKWHLAHTTWFFETFLLLPGGGYRAFNPEFTFLFNSYYKQLGGHPLRARRGLMSRPGLEEVLAYREHVDRAMAELLENPGKEILARVELGLNHEQQHQELIVTDVKYALWSQPLRPAYMKPRMRLVERPQPAQLRSGTPPGWVGLDEGVYEIGHFDGGFAFDNELPRHKVYLEACNLAARPVTNGEYLEFINDGGYSRPELWLSDGWDAVQAEQWRAPLYWEPVAAPEANTAVAWDPDPGPQDAATEAAGDSGWRVFTLAGMRQLDLREPVCHVSYFEADAFARWAGARLPREEEWEVAAATAPLSGNLQESGELHPRAGGQAGAELRQMFGDVWEWTASQYTAYPGFKPAEGALGEYNGKFMCNQFVLRGGSCATPQSHIRASYRNFFPPQARWQFSGIRLAKDGN